MTSSKTRVNRRTINPIESAAGSDKSYIGYELRQTAKTVKDQVLSGSGDDFISQLLGYSDNELQKNNIESTTLIGGELKLGEEIVFPRKRKLESSYKNPDRKPEVRGGLDYISEVLHGSERLSKRETIEIDNKIQEILNELKRLVGTSNILRAEFAQISVEEKPVKSGKYYVNFFEWLLIEIRRLRTKVEDAGVWLVVMKSKKHQRKYGNMAKKFGTTFTLSNERTTATQTG